MHLFFINLEFILGILYRVWGKVEKNWDILSTFLIRERQQAHACMELCSSAGGRSRLHIN